MSRIFLYLIQIIAIIIFAEVLIFADDFRIDNEITAGKIVVRSKTYFVNDDFFGLIEGNGEMTYYNAERDSFTLIAPLLRIQTQLSAAETRREVDAVLNQIRTSKKRMDPLQEFIANPVFKTEVAHKTGQIALQSMWVDYKITTEFFNDPNVAKKYFDFCNLTCYLNCRTTNSYRQLFRLEVNRILRNENCFPKNIAATFYPNGKLTNNNGDTINSSHKIIKRLADEDKNQINNIKNLMNTFKTVKFKDYQKNITKQINGN
ncbi:MAG: hypothetical protein LBP59_05545 [Planctomycetaceae bacterium]|jgi:hypothetical protein|nr:hypothetical protein [Planctomycetaceae bacterium]